MIIENCWNCAWWSTHSQTLVKISVLTSLEHTPRHAGCVCASILWKCTGTRIRGCCIILLSSKLGWTVLMQLWQILLCIIFCLVQCHLPWGQHWSSHCTGPPLVVPQPRQHHSLVNVWNYSDWWWEELHFCCFALKAKAWQFWSQEGEVPHPYTNHKDWAPDYPHVLVPLQAAWFERSLAEFASFCTFGETDKATLVKRID